MIQIPNEIISRIGRHGEKTYPEECIGAVLGVVNDDGRKIAREIMEIENASTENRQRRSLVSPDDYKAADQIADDLDLDIIGWYHSHPDVKAVPSQYDLDNALPWYSYVIVSVKKQKASETRSWFLKEDRSEFQEESIKKY